MKRTDQQLPAVLLGVGILLSATGIQAAAVNASYQGAISTDSGLGLIGQVMQADLSYNDAIAGSASGSGFFYQDFLLSLIVTVGANTWTYDATNGFDNVFLNDDDVLVFAVGTEDRVNLGAGTFAGPDLGTGNVSPFTFNFSLFLQDNVPSGTPDGLTADNVLPGIAPVPELFTLSPEPSKNSMSFSWTAGDPELGTRYTLRTSEVTSVIPLPASVWLLGTAVLAVPAFRRFACRDRAG
jgi:hypothetical protein